MIHFFPQSGIQLIHDSYSDDSSTGIRLSLSPDGDAAQKHQKCMTYALCAMTESYQTVKCSMLHFSLAFPPGWTQVRFSSVLCPCFSGPSRNPAKSNTVPPGCDRHSLLILILQKTHSRAQLGEFYRTAEFLLTFRYSSAE